MFAADIRIAQIVYPDLIARQRKALLVMLALAVMLCVQASLASAQSVSSSADDDTRALPEQLWHEGTRGRSRDDDVLRMGTFAQLAEAASPAVVNIDVRFNARAFPGAMGQASGQGSGFFVHEDGFIVTNAHVVSQASEISVTTSDGRRLVADVVGADEATDLALLRTRESGPFPILPLGDSTQVRPGDWVVAIGNPFGLNHSVTAGIISAVGRREVTPRGLVYADFLQFDAAINLGNSGGPLIDIYGQVIGVNTAIRSGNDIGFAVPSNMLKTLLPQLARGEVVRSFLGVSLQDVTQAEASAQGMEQARGALVSRVVPGSPAEEAGLQPGDVVLSFDGVDVVDSAQLRWLTASAGVGEDATIEVLRQGGRRSLRATLTSQDTGFALMDAQAPGSERGIEPNDQLRTGVPGEGGAAVTEEMESDTDTVRRFGIAVGEHEAEGIGVVVRSVEAASIARLAGLREGDLLTHVNGEVIDSPATFTTVLAAVPRGELLQLRVQRGAAQLFIAFTAR